MKIVTFNGNGKQNWQAVRGLNPDILLLQESPRPPEDISERTEWKPTRNGWGCAAYVKQPKMVALTIDSLNDWLPGWLVGVELDESKNPGQSGKKLRIFSLHTPPPEVSGGSYPKTVKQLLAVIVNNRGDAELVIGGDFNLLSLGARHPDEMKDGKPWTATSQELKIHQQLADLGLINCWRTKNSEIPLAQTLRWRKNPEPAFHCDGLFVPESWKDFILSSDILDSDDWIARSDHNPVVTSFAFPNRQN